MMNGHDIGTIKKYTVPCRRVRSYPLPSLIIPHSRLNGTIRGYVFRAKQCSQQDVHYVQAEAGEPGITACVACANPV
jgi:hypothetical protein